MRSRRYVRVTLVGIDLIGVEGRIVAASAETHLKCPEQIQTLGSAARPRIGGGPAAPELEGVRAETRELRRQIDDLRASQEI